MLADFVAVWTKTQLPPVPLDGEYKMMFFDGSLMKKGAGLGLVFVSPLGFPASNNVVEYEAQINGLCIAVELGIRRLEI